MAFVCLPGFSLWRDWRKKPESIR